MKKSRPHQPATGSPPKPVDFEQADTLLLEEDLGAKIRLMKELGDSGQVEALPRLFFQLQQGQLVPQFQKTTYSPELGEAARTGLEALAASLGLPGKDFLELARHPFYAVNGFDGNWKSLLPTFKTLLCHRGLDRKFYSVLADYLADKGSPGAADVLAAALEANKEDPEAAYLISRALGKMGDPRLARYFLNEIRNSTEPSVVHWDLELLETILHKSPAGIGNETLTQLSELKAFEEEVVDVSEDYGFDSHERTGKQLPVDCSKIQNLAREELGRRGQSQLDDYCKALSDAAQVQIAIRLIQAALPIWEGYAAAHPDAMKEVNALTQPDRLIQDAGEVSADFPRAAVREVETTLAAKTFPGDNPKLKQYLATVMQPLVSDRWDETLSQSARLVYTSVFNLLTFLLLHRNNQDGESHIYISINQACDAHLRENTLGKEQIQAILHDYQHQKSKSGDLDLSARMKKAEADKIISDMKKGLSWMKDDPVASCVETWDYDPDSGHFKYQSVDTVVGYSAGAVPCSEESFRTNLMRHYTYGEFMKDSYWAEGAKKTP